MSTLLWATYLLYATCSDISHEYFKERPPFINQDTAPQGSGVARVAELGGQAGGKGLHQGGKHTQDPESRRYIDCGSEGSSRIPEADKL